MISVTQRVLENLFPNIMPQYIIIYFFKPLFLNFFTRVPNSLHNTFFCNIRMS